MGRTRRHPRATGQHRRHTRRQPKLRERRRTAQLSGALVIDCVRLTAGAIDNIAVQRSASVEEAEVASSRVAAGRVRVDVIVKAAGQSLVVTGDLNAEWVSECRRCLEEVRGALQVRLDEVFEWEPSEGETWPISDQRIDLMPAVREAAMLALPLAALCSPDCAGPAPSRFPTGPAATRVENSG